MKAFLFILLFLFSAFSFSQKDLDDFLIVKKDSLSFYTFTKSGVYSSTFNEDKELDYSFISYSEEVPISLLSITFKTLSAVNQNGDVYFLYPGGGILYKYSNNKIERIDQSFAHRNQYSGYFFSFQNNLYLLGGYGYWTSKNYLTKFNFQSGSWEIVNTSGQIPGGGINQGSFIKKENRLLVYDFYSKNSSSSKDVYNKNLFELDLLTFSWTNRGVLAYPEETKIQKAFTGARIKYKGSLLKKYPNDNFYTIANPFENTLLTFSSEGKLSKLETSGVFIGDNLIYSSTNADREKSKIAFLNISPLVLTEKRMFLLDDRYLFKMYLLFAGIFGLILVSLLFVYFKTKKELFSVEGLSLFNQFSSIILSKEELMLLKAFRDKNVLENSLILELFSDKTISLDAVIKKKNKIINDFNKKFKFSFKNELILKHTDEADSRQVVYVISKNIQIIFQK